MFRDEIIFHIFIHRIIPLNTILIKYSMPLETDLQSAAMKNKIGMINIVVFTPPNSRIKTAVDE